MSAGNGEECSETQLTQQRISKGSVLNHWTPYRVIPLRPSPAGQDDEKYHSLPGYRPCEILKNASKVVCDTRKDHKELDRFVTRLCRDGSNFDALCMLTVLDLAISNEHKDWTCCFKSLSTKERLHENNNSGDDEEDETFLMEGWPLVQERITWESCQEVYRFAKCHLHMVTLPHPLTEYANKTVLNISDEDLDRAIQIAHEHKWIPQMTQNRLQASQFFLDYVASLPARIVGILIDDPSVAKENDTIQQSCLPNASFELSFQDSTKNSIVCSCVAIYDVENGEETSVSTRPPPTTCQCLKCKDERNESIVIDAGSIINARRLAHSYFQRGEYDAATKLYQECHDAIVGEDKYVAADFWHSMAAVDLTRLQFLKAQKRWKDGSQYEKFHSGIAEQLEKQRSYQYFENVLQNANSQTCVAVPKYRSVESAGRLFVTENMVSHDDCRQLIDWAEQHASSGGWTTARHYAVPTTDIPIHKAPRLLEWFTNWMQKEMMALLRAQFQTQERFYVHDAFLVRYDACSSSHFLPLHFDESTHSFVLALNDDFEGGGTYFYALNESFCPKTGTLVSFRGNQLLHGGNCVTKGVRYILAGFLFADDSDSSENEGAGVQDLSTSISSSSSPKRQKTSKESFSFSFF